MSEKQLGMNGGRHEQIAYDALVQACRQAYAQEHMSSIWSWVKCDTEAVRYGPVTGRVSHLVGCTDRQSRYLLQSLFYAGRVIRNPPGNAQGSAVRWWPLGLWDDLKSNPKDTP